ncbi:nucleotide disphospho-sugar-binding domain-containing protein [Amycolatopsis speibonae]|uniref:Nucleotide disphospho-sugar-binding domain-containing protein n=1 Tax=Amycolatopsis speibonae TaxID=1450224 RepID=A0ABV7P2P8_9PSEU
MRPKSARRHAGGPHDGHLRSPPRPHTLGSSLRQPTASETVRLVSANVRYVPFVPLAQLLERVDLVVGAGGVGTVVGTLAHGLPMVLWPQGADQPINAARAAASGTAITVASAAEITSAVLKHSRTASTADEPKTSPPRSHVVPNRPR